MLRDGSNFVQATFTNLRVFVGFIYGLVVIWNCLNLIFFARILGIIIILAFPELLVSFWSLFIFVFFLLSILILFRQLLHVKLVYVIIIGIKIRQHFFGNCYLLFLTQLLSLFPIHVLKLYQINIVDWKITQYNNLRSKEITIH